MLYYNKKNSKKNHYIRTIVLVLIIIVSAVNPESSSYVSKITNIITTPFAKVTSLVSDSFNSVIEATIGSKANRDMVESLTRENQELQKKVNDLSFIVDNQEYLEEAYNLRQRIEAKKANVVMFDNHNLYSEMKLDKGSLSGVELGDIVINSFTDDSNNIVGALVGKIVEVGPNYSIVSTIYDEKFNISFVHSKTGQTGIINERQNLVLEGYLLDKADINQEDLIYTSGVGGRYPRGIYIGQVKEVRESTDKLTQIVQIESPVDFSKMYEVYIIDYSQFWGEEAN